MVSIAAFQAVDLGSIPGQCNFLLHNNYVDGWVNSMLSWAFTVMIRGLRHLCSYMVFTKAQTNI